LAKVFPLMDGDDFDAHVADIDAHEDKITIYENRVLLPQSMACLDKAWPTKKERRGNTPSRSPLAETSLRL
jgi:hypothetical protein